MPLLLERSEALLHGRPPTKLRAHPTSALTAPNPDSPPPTSATRLFRYKGDRWTVAYDGNVLRLRDSKGLHYVAHLLCNPGCEFPATELVAQGSGVRGRGTVDRESSTSPDGDVRSAERARSAVTKRIKAEIRRIAAAHPALGRHLATSVNTGARCSYRPERPVDWEMG